MHSEDLSRNRIASALLLVLLGGTRYDRPQVLPFLCSYSSSCTTRFLTPFSSHLLLLTPFCLLFLAQLASWRRDQQTRIQYARAIAQDYFEGFWDMVPCAFDAAYRQLAPHYPQTLSLISATGIDT